MQLFAPIGKAVSQINDPIFIGVIWRSLAWSLACFAVLHIAAFWAVDQFLRENAWFGNAWITWAAGIAGAIAATLLAMWLFLPVAAAIGMLYLERIARAVETRFYPFLPDPAGESLTLQAWDGVVVALKVLGLNVVALVLALIFPVIGWALGWAIAAYAIGRGLFVAVAMRRMPRPAAESAYRANRSAVMAQGAILALAAYIPLLNLLLPVVGTAAMVHLLDEAMTQRWPAAEASRFNSKP